MASYTSTAGADIPMSRGVAFAGGSDRDPDLAVTRGIALETNSKWRIRQLKGRFLNSGIRGYYLVNEGVIHCGDTENGDTHILLEVALGTKENTPET